MRFAEIKKKLDFFAILGRYDSLGQNLAYNTRSWDSSIRAFYNEVKWFKYGVGLTNPSGQIGHYTQVHADIMLTLELEKKCKDKYFGIRKNCKKQLAV